MDNHPRIAITAGDPKGIGIEIILKSIRCLNPGPFSATIIGEYPSHHADLISKWRDGLSIHLTTLESWNADGSPRLQWIVLPSGPNSVRNSIDIAHKLCIDGQVDGMVTAPINKGDMAKTGSPFWDHTSYLGHLNQTITTMAFFSRNLCISLATVHCPLKDVPDRLTVDGVFHTIHATWNWLRLLGISAPRIAIAGLNPHAGESGLIGDEEIYILAPAILAARTHGITVSEPRPGDTVFWEARQGHYDAVIAMYHDQGLAPLKLIAFEQAVNTTLGLPYIRTSPDHGTALSIAYQDIANPSSMTAAIQLAIRMANGR